MRKNKRTITAILLIVLLGITCILAVLGVSYWHSTHGNVEGEKQTDVSTTVEESPVEEITLTTSPAKENTNDGGIDGHLPAVDTSDEYVILSGHSLE